MIDPWAEKPESLPVGWTESQHYPKGVMDVWLGKLKEEWDAILEHHVTQEEGYEEQIKELKEKADLWDQYAIYDNDNEPKILVKDLITAYEQLEAVKTWLISAKAEGRISMSSGFTLDRILGAE